MFFSRKKLTLKEFLEFREIELSSLKLKKSSYISGGNLQSLKDKNFKKGFSPSLVFQDG